MHLIIQHRRMMRKIASIIHATSSCFFLLIDCCSPPPHCCHNGRTLCGPQLSHHPFYIVKKKNTPFNRSSKYRIVYFCVMRTQTKLHREYEWLRMRGFNFNNEMFQNNKRSVKRYRVSAYIAHATRGRLRIV